MEKNSLIQELLSQRESFFQACWAFQLWKSPKLMTTDGHRLQVVFPGWLNRVAGPDFREARIIIGDSEMFGDVEVHLEESGWKTHGHHRDPGYEKVVLHVILRRPPKAETHTPGGKRIPIFEMLPYLSPQTCELLQDPEGMLKRYDQLPGRCGLRSAQAGPEVLPRVIAHAAEVRARNKADRLLSDFDKKPEEQVLFELVFQSLGYRPYAEIFRNLAARFPISGLNNLLETSKDRARNDVLARWFGALGLLEKSPPESELENVGEEYEEMRERWLRLGEKPLVEPLKKGVSRPWNSPERRMIGLFHHIYGMGAGQWLKGWLAFLHQLDSLRNHPDFRKTALRMLEQTFNTPNDEPWKYRVSFNQPPLKSAAKMIGRDRLIIVMANAVLPFFLAYARRRGDDDLEKLLYRLFIVLPPEAPNQRTRFMEKRLMPLSPLPRTLRNQQGLLQIHQDFCISFLEGCHSCNFPKLIIAQKDQ